MNIALHNQKIALLLAIFLFTLQGLNAQMSHPRVHFNAQLKQDRKLVKHDLKSKIDGIQKRDGKNPALCAVDTSTYADMGSTNDYKLVNLGNSQDLGIFFNAPQRLTLNGFRFYAFLPWDTIEKVKSVDVWCKIYQAGADSLPVGQAIDSVKMTIDTIQGVITFAKTLHDVVFVNPLEIDYNYVIAIENSGSGAYAANVVTNNWRTGDGLGLNLSKVKLNNRWYHSRDVNIDGIRFDANYIISPFVKYDLAAGFTYTDQCYETLDSLRFTNQYRNSVVSSPFYNEYAFYVSTGNGEWCHSWYFNDTAVLADKFNGVYKPKQKYNVNTKLISYLVPYSRNVDICYDSSETTVYFKPDRPMLTDTNGCVNTNEVLKLKSNNELNYYWFNDSSSSVNYFNVGEQFAINNFNKDVTYYITSQNKKKFECDWEYEPVTFKRTAFPDTLNIKTTNVSICKGAFAVLQGDANIGSIWWYDVATSGDPIYKGNIFQTPSLNSNVNYYAEANNSGCVIKSGRVRIPVTVLTGFAPAVPTITGNTSVCVPELKPNEVVQVALNATPASGSSMRWFSSVFSNTPVSTQNSYTVDLYDRGDVYMYAQSWNGACGSSKFPVKITGNRAPKLLATNVEEACFGDSLRLSGFSNWGQLGWYLDTTKSSKAVANGNFVGIKLNDSGARTIFVKVREGDCYNDSWYRVKVRVKPTVVPEKVVSESVCLGSEASILLKGINKETSVLWYETKTDNIVISGDTLLKMGRIFNPTTRFVETLYRGCRSERKSIRVDVLDQPVAGFRVAYPTVQSVSLEPINTRNMTIDWRFGDGNTSSKLSPLHTYTAAGKYTITMIANSTLSDCSDTSKVNVQVKLNGLETIANSVNVYPNPVFAGTNLHFMVTNKEPIASVKILDVSGRLIFENNAVNEPFLRIPENLTEGLYALSIATHTANYTQWVQVSKQ